MKWVAKLGSQTYGNPVGRQRQNFRRHEQRHAARSDSSRTIAATFYAFNEYNGEFLWQLAVPKLASGKVNDWEYLGILSSPLVEGDNVYVVTNRCEVVCLDREWHGQWQ